MPITPKGAKILAAMIGQYGPDRGRQVYYSSINSGKITGVEGKKRKKHKSCKCKKRKSK